MREYKFRGKRIDNGEWVYGYVYKDALIGCNILQTKPCLAAIMVDPSTAGQYTGLKDKNGREIYEGDITDEGIIEYWEGKYVVMQSNGQCRDDLCWCYNKIEVLGNIHDNPELLGGDGNGNHI